MKGSVPPSLCMTLRKESLGTDLVMIVWQLDLQLPV